LKSDAEFTFSIPMQIKNQNFSLIFNEHKTLIGILIQKQIKKNGGI